MCRNADAAANINAQAQRGAMRGDNRAFAAAAAAWRTVVIKRAVRFLGGEQLRDIRFAQNDSPRPAQSGYQRSIFRIWLANIGG